jgi:hypothetical protein
MSESEGEIATSAKIEQTAAAGSTRRAHLHPWISHFVACAANRHLGKT